MKTLTIKNIPDELYQQLKENAKENRHSMSDEVIASIKLALMGRTGELARDMELPDQIPAFTTEQPVTADDIEEAINEGRS